MVSDKIPYPERKTTLKGSWQFMPFLQIIPNQLLRSVLSLLSSTHSILAISQTVQRTVQ